MGKKITKEEYNNEPVVFCSDCLSLNIKVLEEGNEYCDDCGCTEMCSGHIDNWERLYENRYGSKLINLN